MLLWSKEVKKIILIELTCPWEEGWDETFERKRAKYQTLLDTCREKDGMDLPCTGWVEASLPDWCGECLQQLESLERKGEQHSEGW